MTGLLQKVRKVLTDPRLFFRLLNAQLQLRWRADVPISVRLLGRVHVRTSASGQLVIGERAVIVGTVVPVEFIVHDNAQLVIGEATFVNYGTSLSAHESVTIGSRCKIGHYVFVMDNNQHDLVDRTRVPASDPVVLEDDVWIGAHAIILPGVRIGRRAVVGAGSVVTESVPPDVMVAGNPARRVRALV